MGKSNQGSRAPTKDYLIQKGQGLIDHRYGKRQYSKSCQLDPHRWLVWNFNEHDLEEIKSHVQMYIPKFCRVRELQLVQLPCDKFFVSCTCGGRNREGIPCQCFWAITDNDVIEEEEVVDIGMVDVRFLKAFNAHYGDDTELGKWLYKAQRDCFEYENEGTQVSEDYAQKLVGNEDDEYPILGKNTSWDDFREAEFVLTQNACTRYDLEVYRMKEDSDEESSDSSDSNINDGPTLGELIHIADKKKRVVLTDMSKRMQRDIKASMDDECNSGTKLEDCDNELLHTDEEKHDLRKKWIDEMDRILNTESVSKDMVNELDKDITESMSKLWDKHCDMWGKSGGGENKMEWFGHTGSISKPQKRKRGTYG